MTSTPASGAVLGFFLALVTDIFTSVSKSSNLCINFSLTPLSISSNETRLIVLGLADCTAMSEADWSECIAASDWSVMGGVMLGEDKPALMFKIVVSSPSRLAAPSSRL